MVSGTSQRVADSAIPNTTPTQHNPNLPNTQRSHSGASAGCLSMDHPNNIVKQSFGTNPTSTPFRTQYDGNTAKGVGCQRTTSDEHTISTGCQRTSSDEHTISAIHDGVGVTTGGGKACEEHVSSTTPSPFMKYNVEASADELAMFSMMGSCPQDGCEVNSAGDENGEEINSDEVECLAKRQLSKILCMMSEKPLTESISHKSSKPLPPVMGCEDLNEPPEPSDFAGWPDAPVLLRPSASAAPYQVLGPSPLWHEPHQQLQGNDLQGIEVETPLFKGRVLMLMNGLESTPAGVFNGKKRMSWLVVQGKFKQAVSFDELVSGQEFQERLENLPSDWFVEKVLLQLARKINSSMIVGPLSRPSMMSPVVSLAQVINVAAEGSAPDPFTAVEDMRLFDPTLVNASGNPMDANQRRKHFANAAKRAGQQYSSEHVWTFHVWQQFVDMSKYQLDLGITRYNLTRHLAGQPLQFSFKHNKLGQHLFSFDIWHECLL